MNDQEFNEHALANPFDESPEFLAAVAQKPERKLMLEELKQFEHDLHNTLNSVNASAELKSSLLDPEALAQAREKTPSQDTQSESSPAANDSLFFRRAFPLAACLLIAIGLTVFYQPTSLNDAELALQEAVLEHLYHDINDLQMDDNLLVEDVTPQLMAVIGSDFQADQALAQLEVDMIKDCWIAKENSIHMVMPGDVGPITVMIIPGSTIANEMEISDERFAGTITPTPVGNLVVIAEKQESTLALKILLANNLAG